MNIAEKKIAAALKTAMGHTRAGDSPDDALWKAAGVHELNPDMTARTGEMLNIALTHAHFERAADKTASFPTADSAAVVRRLFVNGDEPDARPVTGKAARMFPEVISTADERFLARMGMNAPAVIKSAAPTLADDETPHEFFVRKETAPLPAHGAATVKRALAQRTEWKRAADEARAAATAEFDRALVALQCLEQHFSRVDEIPKYAAFEDQAFGEYGEDVLPYLKLVRGVLPNITGYGDPHHAKRAGAARWESNHANALFDQLVLSEGAHREKTAAAEELRRDYLTKSAALDAAVRELDAPVLELSPGQWVAAKLDFSRGVSKLAEGAGGPEGSRDRLRGLLGLVDRPGAALAARQDHLTKGYAAGQQAHQHAIYKAPGEAADHEMENVRREAILRDLMTNDEIIAGHDPAHVQSAYNALLSTAPQQTTNREVLRAFLRNATAQQAVDPFQAKQLVDLDKATMENKNLRSGKKPDGSAAL